MNLNLTGYTEGRLNDEAATPFTRWTGRRSPGVEIVATTTLNLLHDDWLRRFPVALEVLLLAAAGVGAGFGLSRLRPVPALAAAASGALLIALAGCLLPGLAHRWFPWLVVVAVQIPVALAWSVIAWSQAVTRPASGRTGSAAGARVGVPRIEPPATVTGAALAIPDYRLLREIGHVAPTAKSGSPATPSASSAPSRWSSAAVSPTRAPSTASSRAFAVSCRSRSSTRA